MIAIYTYKHKVFTEKILTNDILTIDDNEKLQTFSEEFSLTSREAEVFALLVNTEDSIQAIAESLYVSRRTLERHISAIYEKTGVKSRVGLIRLYNER